MPGSRAKIRKLRPTLCCEIDPNPTKENNLPAYSAPKVVTFYTSKEAMNAIWTWLVLNLTGDWIVAENYFQHANHYFRAMREKRTKDTCPQWVASAS